MALSWYRGGYRQSVATCSPSTTMHDNSAHDQTTYEQDAAGGTANICGAIDCGATGPADPITKLEAETYQGSGSLDWILEYSNDDSSWTTITPTLTGTNNTWGTRQWTFSANSARYFRISAHNGGIFRIGDLRIYRADGGEVTTSAPDRRRAGSIY